MRENAGRFCQRERVEAETLSQRPESHLVPSSPFSRPLRARDCGPALASLPHLLPGVRRRPQMSSRGFVANFAQKVMTGQLPLSVRRLRGERVELFGRSEALFPGLNHQLFFPDHVHEFDPN